MKIDLLYIDKGLPESLILEILNKKDLIFNFKEILRKIIKDKQSVFCDDISEMINNNQIIRKELLTNIIIQNIKDNITFLNFPITELSYKVFKEILITENIQIINCRYISIHNIEHFLLKNYNPKFDIQQNDEINNKIVKTKKSINKYFNEIKECSIKSSEIKIKENLLNEDSLRLYLSNNFT